METYRFWYLNQVSVNHALPEQPAPKNNWLRRGAEGVGVEWGMENVHIWVMSIVRFLGASVSTLFVTASSLFKKKTETIW